MATSLTQIPTRGGVIVGRYRLRHIDETYAGGLGGVQWKAGRTVGFVEGHHLRRLVAGNGDVITLEPWDEETARMPEVQAKLGVFGEVPIHPDTPTYCPFCGAENQRDEGGQSVCPKCDEQPAAERRARARATVFGHLEGWEDERLVEMVELGSDDADHPEAAEVLRRVLGQEVSREQRIAAIVDAMEAAGVLERIAAEVSEHEAQADADADADAGDDGGSEDGAGRKQDGTVNEGSKPSAAATAPEAAGSTSADNRAPELDQMDREQLKAFAREQGLAEKVDLRLGRDELEARIREVLTTEG